MKAGLFLVKGSKTMTMVEASHLTSGMDKFCIKEVTKVGGGGLMSVECCNEEKENSLRFANSEVNLIRGIDSAKKLNTEDTVIRGEFKKQKAKKLKQN